MLVCLFTVNFPYVPCDNVDAQMLGVGSQERHLCPPWRKQLPKESNPPTQSNLRSRGSCVEARGGLRWLVRRDSLARKKHREIQDNTAFQVVSCDRHGQEYQEVVQDGVAHCVLYLQMIVFRTYSFDMAVSVTGIYPTYKFKQVNYICTFVEAPLV